MGNTNTKEAREPVDPRAGRAPPPGPGADQPQGFPGSSSSRQRNRPTRSDLSSLLGISHSGGSSSQAPYERRETRQEREARRLERERQHRLVERERSLREEHVDGGYLVTLGTYVGPEDYSKPTVRQLQIERKLAPFWRGLNDFSETWAEHQIVAVARGLPLPAANETPPEELIPRPLPTDSPSASSQNINSLTVPLGDRTQSTASDKSGAVRGSAIPSSPTSAAGGAAPARTSSPFKHRPKALAAALSITPRNGSTTEIVPREIKLANDPFVNGQPLEVALYKDASECPICFLYYPPYLNHTRCCDQPICSECFVQIKRADPHYPEGHGDGEQPERNPEEQAGLLISEPACCPYCQQPELGVTYDPPPFRRGLVYSAAPGAGSLGVGNLGTAMSSSSSLSSNLSPTSLVSPTSASGTTAGRRRTQSLSANAPNVITTDRVRPDWATKLAAQRAHIARRAAAATALHTAAFLMGSAENRPFRVGRFSRRNTGGSGSAASGGAPSGPGGGIGADAGANASGSGPGTPQPGDPNAPGSNRNPLAGGNRRSRMEDLEEMMFAEAIRLSLAAEEERKRKAEKEERKEAKRKEKEERKAAKAAAKASSSGSAGGTGPYGSGSGHSSATGSTLSLSGLVGRRRGNSAASNLRVEASVANAMATTAGGAASNPAAKGKGIDRSEIGAGGEQQSASSSSPSQPAATTTPATGAQPIPSPSNRPVGPSHLRQMSSASSVTSSSLTDNTPGGSFRGQSPLAAGDPRASGLSLGGRSDDSEGGAGSGGDRGGDDKDPSTSTEPMFNFNSLAQMVGVQLEGAHAGRRLSAIGRDADAASTVPGNGAEAQQESPRAAEDVVGRAGSDDARSSPNNTPAAMKPAMPPAPELVITPGTPAPDDTDGFEDSKRQLGFQDTATVEHHANPRESVG